VAPLYFASADSAPPAYTVKLVDDIPAGNLGAHVAASAHEPPKPEPAKPKEEEPQVRKESPPPEDDKDAIALASSASPTPSGEPTPKPTSTPEATPRATRSPKPKPTPKAEKTPNVEQQLAKLREQLLAEHLKDAKKRAPSEESGAAEKASGGGPVAADVAMAGTGGGIGAGSGSAGIQQDLEFLLYYRAVQERIKEAWVFSGSSPDLTTTVNFAIAPDGKLAGVKLSQSSHDGAFDDSVVRAIKRAAPFPPPPEKFRSEFEGGIEALFKLGELKS
ncbi:MAG: TonB family protein, partial [Burkholderiales bacterium]